MKLHLRLCAAALALGAMASLGCGQAMQATNVGGGNGKLSSDPVFTLQKAQDHTASAEAALADAEATLDGIVDSNGNIHLPDADGTVTVSASTQSLTGLPEKLRAVLDKVLAKITLPVQRAKDMINMARQQITIALGQLDPNNPDQAQMIDKLNQMMAKLDAIEARLGDIYKLLAAKVDMVIGRFDQLIGRLDRSNPLMAIALMELNELRQVLVDFRDKLASM